MMFEILLRSHEVFSKKEKKRKTQILVKPIDFNFNQNPK